MRVIELGGVSYGREKASGADLYIEPDLLPFKRNDFHRADEMAQVGHAATRDALGRVARRGRATSTRRAAPICSSGPHPYLIASPRRRNHTWPDDQQTAIRSDS